MDPELTPVEVRQNEVDQYTQNVSMYQALYESLPHEWPERLLKYRGTNEHDACAVVEDLADVVLLAQLFQSDAAYKAIRTEMLERTKAAGILGMMQA